MKSKLILLYGLMLLNISLIMAVSINDVYFTDRSYNNKSIANETGDHIIAQINVEQSYTSIRRVYLAWETNSWVDCNRIKINNGSVDYKCILTVTPYMNKPTDVFIIVLNYTQMTKVLLGNYNFNGQLFPVYETPITNASAVPRYPSHRPAVCPLMKVCTQYELSCNRVCERQSPKGYCYTWKKICTPTTNCLRYTSKNVCPR